MEAFHNIHCYDYILKPYTEESVIAIIEKILIDYFDHNIYKNKYIILEFKGIKQKVNTKDIILIESKNCKIFIRTQFEEIRYKHMNLSQFSKNLPEQFLQVHQSILVNTDYIIKINMSNNELVMKILANTIPIGVTYKRRYMNILMGFYNSVVLTFFDAFMTLLLVHNIIQKLKTIYINQIIFIILMSISLSLFSIFIDNKIISHILSALDMFALLLIYLRINISKNLVSNILIYFVNTILIIAVQLIVVLSITFF